MNSSSLSSSSLNAAAAAARISASCNSLAVKASVGMDGGGEHESCGGARRI